MHNVNEIIALAHARTLALSAEHHILALFVSCHHLHPYRYHVHCLLIVLDVLTFIIIHLLIT